MADVRTLIEQVPPVTRFLLVSVGLCTFPVLLGMLDVRSIYLSWFHVRHFYQIYRLVTPFFFGGKGFPLVYDFFLIYRNSSALERDTFMSRTPDYAWAHIMIGLFILIINIPFNEPFLFRPLLHAQNYLWCRANPSMKISIFGLLTVPVPYYPYALIVLDLVLGGPNKAIQGGIGLLAGHAWWFFSNFLPLHPSSSIRLRNPFATPTWFANLFTRSRERPTIRGSGFTGFAGRTATRLGGAGVRANTVGGSTGSQSTGVSSGVAPPGGVAGAGSDAAAAREMRTRYNWGTGERLGGEGL